jgi:uncharacterized protein (DUF2132 family)
VGFCYLFEGVVLLLLTNKQSMKEEQLNNPLHGKTLEAIVTKLVDRYGWEELGDRIPINCFIHDPSIKSSLTFLRKTPWARKKVEDLYVKEFSGN